MGLILDSYGRPVLHPGDVIALFHDGEVRQPLRITRVTRGEEGTINAYRIYFKDAINEKEEWVFSHDSAVKLLARADEPTVT